MRSVLAPRANWMRLLEAIHAEEEDEQRWAEAIYARLGEVFEVDGGVGVSVVEHPLDCSSARYRALAMTPAFHRAEVARDAGLRAFGVETFRKYYYPAGLVTTHGEIERGERSAAVKRLYEGHAIVDTVGVLAHPRPGVVTTIYAMDAQEIRLSRHDRALLTRLALHLDAVQRLRTRASEPIAVIDEHGKLLHHGPDAPSATSLRHRVAALAAREAPVLELWPALIEGRLSLVRRIERGKVRYLVLHNPPASQPMRAWSTAEIDAVTQAARGLSTKLVGYALGVAPATVSHRIASAAAKLGASTRTELVRLAAMLTRDPRASFPEVDLTEAEAEILRLLAQGLSNRDIAQHRARSVRTIANQVARLLRKTKAASRRELAARK